MRNLIGTLVFTTAITGGMLLDNWKDYLEDSMDFISITGISKLDGPKGYTKVEENSQVSCGSKILLSLEAYDADGIETLRIRVGDVVAETYSVNHEMEFISKFSGYATVKVPNSSGDVKISAEIIDLKGQLKKANEYVFKMSGSN